MGREGRAAKFREFGFFYLHRLIMPEGIAQIEKAILHLNIAAFFQRTFPVCRAVKTAIKELHPGLAIQCPFFIKCLFSIFFHFPYLSVKNPIFSLGCELYRYAIAV